MNLPSITSQQEHIINLLFQFRYLLVRQLLKLLNHQDPRRIQEWLDDLVKKKYLAKIINEEIAKGFVYCLDQRARHILKKDEDIDHEVLGRLYKEKSKEVLFLKKNLFIVDIFLHFLANKQKNEELNFFTAQELRNFDYFPDPRPSAYIETVEGKETNRYFLEYFDDYTPHTVVRKKVQYYLEYCHSEEWQTNTEDMSFPTILFVLPNYKFKKHIQIYSQALFEKNLNDDIDLFLTTKEEIKTGKVKWEEVAK